MADTETRFGLRRTEAEDFFPEWCNNLPPLTDAERASLDLIRRGFIDHRQDARRGIDLACAESRR